MVGLSGYTSLWERAMGRGKVLVVDNEERGRRILARELARSGFEPDVAADPFEALERIRSSRYALVVTDFEMPGMDGLELLTRIREFSAVPLIVISAYGTIPLCEQAILLGAHRFLRFDEDIDQLGEIAIALVDAPIEESAPPLSAQAARERRSEDLRRWLQAMVAESGGNVSEIARRWGKDRSTVRYHLRRLGLWGAEAE
jgi:DNA-binding NtrC family response regulator